MVVRLLNSAMIPAEGYYKATKISKEEFVAILRANRNNFVSSIGYPETARYIEQISGVPVPISREPTVIEDGDQILVCKLAYRVQNPALKGRLAISDETAEFWLIEYKA